MKYQVMILLLAGLVAYANAVALSSTSVTTLTVKKADGTTALAATVYVGEVIQFKCSIVDIGVKQGTLFNGAATLKQQTALAAVTTAAYDWVYDHTVVTGDIGTLAVTCQFGDLAGSPKVSVKSTPAISIVVAAATTTAAPTTVAGKSGAESITPLLSMFLLSIAAMCF